MWGPLEDYRCVWVFNASPWQGVSAIFADGDKAEDWARKHQLYGMLTAYPVGVGTYDWAVKVKVFKPRKPHQMENAIIQTFSDASQPHFHYEPDDNGTVSYTQITDSFRVHPFEGDHVWVFNGEKGMMIHTIPSVVFVSMEQGQEWVQKNNLTGLLTMYPVNQSLADWSIEQGVFVPKWDMHYHRLFLGQFTYIGQPRVMFESGRMLLTT
jgi:hypothetical protein